MTGFKAIILCLFLTLLLVPGLYAQDGESGESAAQNEVDETSLVFEDQADAVESDSVNGSSVWTYVSVVLVLALVVGAIYLLFYFLKKASSVTFRENDDIRIIATKQISNTKQLHIIQVGNEYSLIGAAENGITHLKEITDEDTVNKLNLSAAEEHPRTKKGFQEILSSFIPGRKKPGVQDEENSNMSKKTTQESSSFLKTQQDRLKKL